MSTRASRLVPAAAAAALVLAACSGDKSPTDTNPPPTTTANTVSFGTAKATVAIAESCASRGHGLMGVTRMAADSGMLFVFAYDSYRQFYMKDTPIPLSIAFLDLNKKVVFLADMAPNDSIARYGGLSSPQMRYALEMNQGWFASHGVTVGTYGSFTVPSGLVIENDCFVP